MQRYEYDPFQKKAIEAINEGHSVLVSAPTGSGKTAIAEYVIEMVLQRKERVIYTAPIKAISNQKYRDFLGSYPNDVGILTGDVSINADAPVLIMTTEIYRNQLFENPEKHRKTSWVIFDEVHYLDDYERGTVWEEAFMFSHPQTRFLALSATAPNVDELARWIESIQGHKIVVVKETKRPVALEHHFQCQNRIFNELESLKKEGYMGMNSWSKGGAPSRHQRRRFQSHQWHRELRAKPNLTNDLLKYLIKNNRMPCLYFAFGRKRVEELAREHTHLQLISEEDAHQNRKMFDELCIKYELTHEKSAIEMRGLVEEGIAFHHAGMLPTLKEVVEQLFTAKRIQLIFTTETFALGINMPARTVVFDELRKFYGFGFDNLTTRDYFQMAGRAGRRGIDTVGYVYSRLNPHQISVANVTKIVHGDMEPIMSQFNASYATLLNLYKHYGKRLVEIYPRSFHYFQSNAKRHKKGVAAIERKLTLLEKMEYIKNEKLTAKGEFAACVYGYELILAELLASGFFENLSTAELCVLLVAVIYEPRKNEFPKRLPSHFNHLEKEAKRAIRNIHEAELNTGIYPQTKFPYFNLTEPMEAWVKGQAFHEISKHTEVDEGILIRYFRMVIQLLREIGHASSVSDRLRDVCSKALPLIDRDIVDAEKLLRNI